MTKICIHCEWEDEWNQKYFNQKLQKTLSNKREDDGLVNKKKNKKRGLSDTFHKLIISFLHGLGCSVFELLVDDCGSHTTSFTQHLMKK